MKISKTILLLLSMVYLLGCENTRIFTEPDIVKDKGVTLGSSKEHVHKQLGTPTSELNFLREGQRVSIWNYGQEELDYQPGVFEEDGIGIRGSEGITPHYRKESRLVFVNGYLCSIEDFIHNKTYTMPPEQLPPSILDVLEFIQRQE